MSQTTSNNSEERDPIGARYQAEPRESPARTSNASEDQEMEEAELTGHARRNAVRRHHVEGTGWESKMLDILDNLETPGSFAMSGSMAAQQPGLHVPELGRINLPLDDGIAENVKKLCVLAPFGRGEGTMHDTSVRHTWQLEPSQFQLRNKGWETAINKALHEACDSLGAPREGVSAELYKLLLYEPGSHFKPHRDSEKAQGMWGTMVVLLPSKYKGGELILRHNSNVKTFDLAKSNDKETHYLAFYADCEHEIRPVTAGHRLALVYNLVSPAGAGYISSAGPDQTTAIASMKAALQEWEQEEKSRAKAVYILQHRYTEEGLKSINQLKGADRAVASLLGELQQQGLVEGGLAFVNYKEIGEMGDDDYVWEGGEFDAMGLDCSAEAIMDLGKTKNLALPLDINIPIDFDEELLQVKYFFDTDFDEDECEGPTGNEGCPATRWYTRTGFIFWPKSKHYEALCAMDLSLAIQCLEEGLGSEENDAQAEAQGGNAEAPAGTAAGTRDGDRGEAPPSATSSLTRDVLVRLSASIMDKIPLRDYYNNFGEENFHTSESSKVSAMELNCRLVDCLKKLKDITLGQRYVKDMAPKIEYNTKAAGSVALPGKIIKLCGALGWDEMEKFAEAYAMKLVSEGVSKQLASVLEALIEDSSPLARKFAEKVLMALKPLRYHVHCPDDSIADIITHARALGKPSIVKHVIFGQLLCPACSRGEALACFLSGVAAEAAACDHGAAQFAKALVEKIICTPLPKRIGRGQFYQRIWRDDCRQCLGPLLKKVLAYVNSAHLPDLAVQLFQKVGLVGFSPKVCLEELCTTAQHLGWETLAPAVHAVVKEHGNEYTSDELLTLLPSDAVANIPEDTRLEVGEVLVKKLEKGDAVGKGRKRNRISNTDTSYSSESGELESDSESGELESDSEILSENSGLSGGDEFYDAIYGIEHHHHHYHHPGSDIDHPPTPPAGGTRSATFVVKLWEGLHAPGSKASSNLLRRAFQAMARDTVHFSAEESLMPALEIIAHKPGAVICDGFYAAAEGVVIDQVPDICCDCKSCTDIKAFVKGIKKGPLSLPKSRSTRHERDVVASFPGLVGTMSEGMRLVVTKHKDYEVKRKKEVKKRAEELCKKLTGGDAPEAEEDVAGPSNAAGKFSRPTKRSKRG